MQDMKADIWIVNDPQPAGVIQFLPNFHPSACHLHIDLSSPNREVWDFVAGFLEGYDRVVVSSQDFVRQDIKEEAVVFAPAIDPLRPKNQPMELKTAQQILTSFGINIKKPLITQVSRFDPWKDPLGVIKAYQTAKKEIPDLQLAMVGFFLAQDDPEGIKVFNIVKKEAQKDPNIFLFSDPSMLGSLKVDEFVNAIQVASDVILQKSIKEGFGLTVTEAMWKGKAVIGGNAGGIKTQIKDKENGFIVNNPQQAAEQIIKLVKDPGLRQAIGEKAHLTVKNNFLMPRLLKDYLKLFKDLKSIPSTSQTGAEDLTNILNCY